MPIPSWIASIALSYLRKQKVYWWYFCRWNCSLWEQCPGCGHLELSAGPLQKMESWPHKAKEKSLLECSMIKLSPCPPDFPEKNVIYSNTFDKFSGQSPWSYFWEKKKKKKEKKERENNGMQMLFIYVIVQVPLYFFLSCTKHFAAQMELGKCSL